jgi:hypothetical protein
MCRCSAGIFRRFTCVNVQVFCGKIPKDMYEDELIPLFEKWGKIWDLRLMMDPMSGLNRSVLTISINQFEKFKCIPIVTFQTVAIFSIYLFKK